MSAVLDGISRVKSAARLTDTVKLRRSLLAPAPAPVSPRAAAGDPPARGFSRVVRLGEDGVKSLEAALPYAPSSPLAGRLALGDSCYAAVRRCGEGRAWGVQAMMWVATDRPVYVYELDGEVALPAGVAWVYEAFTFPEARNRGIARTILNRIVRDLADEHASGEPAAPRCLEAWVSRRNLASLKVFRGQGFEPYGWWKLAAFGRARLLRGDASLRPEPARPTALPSAAPRSACCCGGGGHQESR